MSFYKRKKESLHDIETLSIKQYYDIAESGDTKRLKKSLSFVTDEELENRWAEINDDITEIAGVSETRLQILKHKVLKAQHLDAAHNKNEKWRATLAAVEEANIQELEETTQTGGTLTETLLTLSKIQGYRIKSDDISTMEYFTLIKINNDSNKKQ